jgi:hypothetical protein
MFQELEPIAAIYLLSLALNNFIKSKKAASWGCFAFILGPWINSN